MTGSATGFGTICDRIQQQVPPISAQEWNSSGNYHSSNDTVHKHWYLRSSNAIVGNRKGKALFSSAAIVKGASPPSPSYGLYRLLSQDERTLLEEQKQLIEASRQLASKVEATAKSTEEATRSLLSAQQHSSRHFLEGLHLEATFSVVVAGEFNAGKSTLINALLGSKLLETGALPTTDSITVVRAAGGAHEAAAVNRKDEDRDASGNLEKTKSSSPPLSPLGVVVHSVENLPLLEDLTLVDTPGTNSAWMDHTERTKKMLPAADLILFVTSADRPFSDSERSLLQSIQAYRKNIVVVINKMDILETGDQKTAIVDFVTDKASELLGARPVVLPVSGRDALAAKLSGSPNPNSEEKKAAAHWNEADRSEAWQKSNFGALESFLKETLTGRAKVRSKLSNPIGVAEGVMAKCLEVLENQKEELRADFSTLAIVESQFEGWKKELSADLDKSRSAMTEMVEQEGHRCEILVHRMKNPFEFYSWTLFDRDRLEEEWSVTQREVSMTIHRQHDEDLRADLMEHVIETA
jgi:small GTP-binding protein